MAVSPVRQTSQEAVTHKIVNLLFRPNPSKQQQHNNEHGNMQKSFSV